MNEYVAALRNYVAENLPNYGSDAHSILEMLYCYYHECNNAETDAVKTTFEDLYQQMHGMPPRGNGSDRGCRLYPLPGA